MDMTPIEAQVEHILLIVDEVERNTNSAQDRLNIIEAVITDLKCRADATRENVRRDRASSAMEVPPEDADGYREGDIS